MTITRLDIGPRMSQAAIHNGVIYTAGQVDDTGATVGEQTRNILAKIDALLAAAGSDKSKVLSATIILPDLATFGEMNAVWDAWVVPGATPARTTLGGGLVLPAFKVEIAVIAAV